MKQNNLLLTDSYKPSHWSGLAKDVSKTHFYLEARGGEFKSTVMMGYRNLIAKYLGQEKFFTYEDVQEAAHVASLHFGTPEVFNKAGWLRLLDRFDGALPIKVTSVAKEGSVIPIRNCLMSYSMDGEFPWLTGYIEDLVLQMWYPITVATLTANIKKIIFRYLQDTGDPSLIDFKLHDFGVRGTTCMEQAAIGGAAHLTSFKGTDNLPAIKLVRSLYNDGYNYMPGYSIPALEHSVVTSWGKEHEAECFENFINANPNSPMIACVIDSYNTKNAVNNIFGSRLKKLVLEKKGIIVLRPDSGDPCSTSLQVINDLWNIFGGKVNKKGYKVLDSHVRVIWGDGVDLVSIDDILATITTAGFSADNIAFGMGGALLQKVNRDTCKFAIKCSAIETCAGKVTDVFKDPITDPGKKSKAGIQRLAYNNGEYLTTTNKYFGGLQENYNTYESFEDVRQRLNAQFDSV